MAVPCHWPMAEVEGYLSIRSRPEKFAKCYLCRMLFRILSLLFLSTLVWGCARNDEGKQERAGQEDPTSPSSMISIPLDEDGQPDASKLARMSFDTTVHSFGKIREGEVVEYAFEFTNTGKVALLVSDANTSCGCTVAEVPREPIAPGEKGRIVARFDSKGRVGMQRKFIDVKANTYPSSVQLIMQGDVLPKN